MQNPVHEIQEPRVVSQHLNMASYLTLYLLEEEHVVFARILPAHQQRVCVKSQWLVFSSAEVVSEFATDNRFEPMSFTAVQGDNQVCCISQLLHNYSGDHLWCGLRVTPMPYFAPCKSKRLFCVHITNVSSCRSCCQCLLPCPYDRQQ